MVESILALKTNNHLEDKREIESSRMVIINNYRKKIGIDVPAIQFLQQKTRKSTNIAYGHSWNRWSTWYYDNHQDPL